MLRSLACFLSLSLLLSCQGLPLAGGLGPARTAVTLQRNAAQPLNRLSTRYPALPASLETVPGEWTGQRHLDGHTCRGRYGGTSAQPLA